MCHHSLPSMLTPIDKKKSLIFWLMIVYILVLIVYFMITMTGIFAFDEIEDVYTLNFIMNQCGLSNSTDNIAKKEANIAFFNLFLPSYPIFTIFSSYTVIALTLINNLKIVLAFWVDAQQPALRYTYPLIALVPPLVVSIYTENVALIVSLVGAYTGSLIQYVFPTLLVYYSRRAIQMKYLAPYISKEGKNAQLCLEQQVPSEVSTRTNNKQQEKKETCISDEQLAKVKELYFASNAFASPFQHNAFCVATAVWWIFSVIMVTIDQVILHLPKHDK